MLFRSLGQVIFEPEEDVQKETEKRMQEEAEKQKLLEELKGKENITPDGRNAATSFILFSIFLAYLSLFL